MEDISKTLYVEYFPLDTTQDVLQDIFSKFGKINRIELPHFAPEHPLCHGLSRPKTKGYAFLEFLEKSDADMAHQFFNDLNNILSIKEQLGGDEQQDENEDESKEDRLKSELLSKLEYKELMPIRVMTKKRFLEYEQQYEERRLKSLIKAAKLLVITCPNLYS